MQAPQTDHVAHSVEDDICGTNWYASDMSSIDDGSDSDVDSNNNGEGTYRWAIGRDGQCELFPDMDVSQVTTVRLTKTHRLFRWVEEQPDGRPNHIISWGECSASGVFVTSAFAAKSMGRIKEKQEMQRKKMRGKNRRRRQSQQLSERGGPAQGSSLSPSPSLSHHKGGRKLCFTVPVKSNVDLGLRDAVAASIERFRETASSASGSSVSHGSSTGSNSPWSNDSSSSSSAESSSSNMSWMASLGYCDVIKLRDELRKTTWKIIRAKKNEEEQVHESMTLEQ